VTFVCELAAVTWSTEGFHVIPSLQFYVATFLFMVSFEKLVGCCSN